MESITSVDYKGMDFASFFFLTQRRLAIWPFSFLFK